MISERNRKSKIFFEGPRDDKSVRRENLQTLLTSKSITESTLYGKPEHFQKKNKKKSSRFKCCKLFVCFSCWCPCFKRKKKTSRMSTMTPYNYSLQQSEEGTIPKKKRAESFKVFPLWQKKLVKGVKFARGNKDSHWADIIYIFLTREKGPEYIVLRADSKFDLADYELSRTSSKSRETYLALNQPFLSVKSRKQSLNSYMGYFLKSPASESQKGQPGVPRDKPKSASSKVDSQEQYEPNGEGDHPVKQITRLEVLKSHKMANLIGEASRKTPESNVVVFGGSEEDELVPGYRRKRRTGLNNQIKHGAEDRHPRHTLIFLDTLAVDQKLETYSRMTIEMKKVSIKNLASKLVSNSLVPCSSHHASFKFREKPKIGKFHSREQSDNEKLTILASKHQTSEKFSFKKIVQGMQFSRKTKQNQRQNEISVQEPGREEERQIFKYLNKDSDEKVGSSGFRLSNHNSSFNTPGNRKNFFRKGSRSEIDIKTFGRNQNPPPQKVKKGKNFALSKSRFQKLSRQRPEFKSNFSAQQTNQKKNYFIPDSNSIEELNNSGIEGGAGDSRMSKKSAHKGMLAFEYLNRESDEFLLENYLDHKEEITPEEYERMLNDTYDRLHSELRTESSFFSKLIRKFVESITPKKNKPEDPYNSDGDVNRISCLINAILTFSGLLSLAVFELFEDNGRIVKPPSIEPSQIFISLIVASIFNSKLSIPTPLDQLGYGFGEGEDCLNLVLFNQYFTESVKEQHIDALLEFEQAKIEMLNSLKNSRKNKLLHVLFELNEESLEAIGQLIQKGGEKKVKNPEFLIEAKRMSLVPRDTSKPYERCLRILNNISRERSPYKKLFSLFECIDTVASDIDDFYEGYGIDAEFLLTAEELFPIIVHLLLNMEARDFTIQLLITELFLTEEMRLGHSGFCVNTFLAAHEFIVGYNFIDRKGK